MQTVNEKLARYYQITQIEKDLDKEKSELRKWLVEKGSCSSAEYVAFVEPRKSERLAGLKEVEKVISRSELERFGLITLTESVNVVVKPKGREIA